MVTTEEIAEKTEKYTTRFWAEIFGTIHIGFSFLTSFILQLFRFVSILFHAESAKVCKLTGSYSTASAGL